MATEHGPPRSIKKSNCQKCSALIVNLVNPRFVNYNRPLFVAILVGSLTFCLFIALFQFIQNAAMVTENTQQVIGDVYKHIDFAQSIVDPVNKNDYIISTLCVDRAESLASSNSVNDNLYTPNGSHPILSHPCIPSIEWRSGGVIPAQSAAPALDVMGYKFPLCGPSKYWVNDFSTKPPAEPTVTGVETIEADPDYRGLECQLFDKQSGGVGVQLLVTYRITVKQYPTLIEAAGSALAYTTYIELLVTIAVVIFLLQCGCIVSKASLYETAIKQVEMAELASETFNKAQGGFGDPELGAGAEAGEKL